MLHFKTWPVLLTWLGLSAVVISEGSSYSGNPSSTYPKREIANISVIDTPLVRAAERFALQHSNNAVYKHLMRSWLYGVLMINANDTLSRNVDLEVHAISALLHDLGWDSTGNSPLISPDRRFEVDGAFAARSFILDHADGRGWEARRVQLVWDAIALHTERSIAYYKELEVQVVSRGISLDFSGPGFGVSEDDFATIGKSFPKNDLKNQVNESIILLCETKPQTTYDLNIPIALEGQSPTSAFDVHHITLGSANNRTQPTIRSTFNAVMEGHKAENIIVIDDSFSATVVARNAMLGAWEDRASREDRDAKTILDAD
ncbi:hypothetical protein FDECE_14154 [Fusarium decemcellulare]|nr:hypothetical protein FDECE_14154 [Fusarium decemcellulare]